MKRKTHAEFLASMSNINPYIEFESEYVTSRQKIDCKCKKCGTKWKATGNALLSGTGCPHCAAVGKCLKSQKEFEQEVSNAWPFIKVVGKYNGSKSRIECYCTSCKKTFNAHAQGLLQGHLGHRCPVHHQSRNKDPKIFKEEMAKINDSILLLEDYMSTDIKVYCKCKKCNHEWYANPSDLLNGHGCPCCTVSRGELKIHSYAKMNNIEYIPQYSPPDCRHKYPLHFDVYFPQYEIIVEYDGRQHFEPIERWGGDEAFNDVKVRDEIKNKYCENNNIKMIRIPYWEYKNINNILDTYFA